jgi:hypothetical protein
VIRKREDEVKRGLFDDRWMTMESRDMRWRDGRQKMVLFGAESGCGINRSRV